MKKKAKKKFMTTSVLNDATRQGKYSKEIQNGGIMRSV